jgi:hypothetical protein
MSALVGAPRAIAQPAPSHVPRAASRGRPGSGVWPSRVDQILTHWAEHDLNHLEQIRAALRAHRQRSAVSK